MGFKFKLFDFKREVTTTTTNAPASEKVVDKKDVNASTMEKPTFDNDYLSFKEVLSAKIKSQDKLCIVLQNVPEDTKTVCTTSYPKLRFNVGDNKCFLGVLLSGEDKEGLEKNVQLPDGTWTCFTLSPKDLMSIVFSNEYSGIGVYNKYAKTQDEVLFSFGNDMLEEMCRDAGIWDDIVTKEELKLAEDYLIANCVKESKVEEYMQNLYVNKDILKEFVYYIKNNRFKDNEINVLGYTASRIAAPPHNFKTFMPFSVLMDLRKDGPESNIMKYLLVNEMLNKKE